MKFDPRKHRRRSIRLHGYDYSSPAAYFITICTDNRQVLFGEVVGGQMRRNSYGEIVQEEWFRSATIRKEINLDAWIVMPNHVHGIVTIIGPHGHAAVHDNVPAIGAHRHGPLRVPPRRPRSLATFVGGFKGAVTIHINKLRRTPGVPIWQRNYYEHIVRDEDELNRIREYILTNPLRWGQDRENPERWLTDGLDEDPDWYLEGA